MPFTSAQNLSSRALDAALDAALAAGKCWPVAAGKCSALGVKHAKHAENECLASVQMKGRKW
ncbi:MAG: hypothetical protein CMM01_02490 [Rhodopirellula sp.]|nr:hypothetical protein [Rhodopirellula sp.]